MEQTRTNKVIWNTGLLTVAALLLRGAGVWFNALLAGRAGAAGVGLFSLLMSVYGLALTFGGAGVRLAATRLTAEERNVRRPGGGMGHVFRLALLLSIAAALLLYFCADLAAEQWLHDARAARALRLLAPSIVPVTLSAALGGYCNAAGAVVPFAAVQLIEQGIKIVATLTALKGSSGSTEAVCAAMAIGITVGEWLSCALSFGVYGVFGLMQRHSQADTKTEAPTPLRTLLRIAAPDGLGASARGILLTAEHLLIPPGLRKSGADGDVALAAYGTIHGLTLPLLLYPSAVLSSLANLLVPEVARLRSGQNPRRIQDISTRLIHLTLVFALGTAAVIFAFAPQLASAVYGNTGAADSLRLLAPLIPIMYLDMTVDGILKGLDEQKAVMRYNVMDSALCVLLVLIALPPLGVRGYYLLLYAAELLNFTLSANHLLTVASADLHLWESVGKPTLCALLAWGGTQLLFGKAAGALSPVPAAVLLVAWMAALYLVLQIVTSKKTMRGLGSLPSPNFPLRKQL
ncbi:MAG: oligosaccharide flippase family protein [Oscillospiraceae bacterium]|jgi:stage V sporulation protein B|nr:oligosaccharide flippase family protein [Oscillospiraceae bacterium]